MVGEFVSPMTQAKFLFSPLVQYNALVDSLRRYNRKLDDERLKLSRGMTRSGALALLHRLGPHALPKWERHQEPTTLALYKRANGLF